MTKSEFIKYIETVETKMTDTSITECKKHAGCSYPYKCKYKENNNCISILFTRYCDEILNVLVSNCYNTEIKMYMLNEIITYIDDVLERR